MPPDPSCGCWPPSTRPPVEVAVIQPADPFLDMAGEDCAAAFS